MKRLLTIFLVLFSIGPIAESNAQRIVTSLDSTKILIGDYVYLKVNTTYPNTTFIPSPILVDSNIKPFEIVEKLKSDTLRIGSDIAVIDNYILTCFQMGNVHFPAIKYSYQNQDFFTDSIPLTVQGIQLDTTGKIKPIKGPVQVPLTFAEVIPYFMWVILGIALLLIALYIYKKYFKKEAILEEEKIEEPPHIIALRKLKELDEEKLWQQEKVKEYYIKLSDTVREYIERRFTVNALEQTTDELLFSLKKAKVNQTQRAAMERMLTLSDLAKFAKTQPGPMENTECMNLSVEFIQKTKQNIELDKGQKEKEVVKRYYSKNEYGLQSTHDTKYNLRLLLTSLGALIVIPLLFFIIVFGMNILPIIIFLTNYALPMAIGFVAMVGIVAYILYNRRKNQTMHYRLIFGQNAIIERRKGQKDKIIAHEQIKSIVANAKGEITIQTDNSTQTIHVSNLIEKYTEVKERIAVIMPIEFL